MFLKTNLNSTIILVLENIKIIKLSLVKMSSVTIVID